MGRLFCRKNQSQKFCRNFGETSWALFFGQPQSMKNFVGIRVINFVGIAKGEKFSKNVTQKISRN